MAERSLETLGLSPAVLGKIRALSVSTTEGLRSIIEAAPADVERFLGRETFDSIVRALGSLSADRRPRQFEPDDRLLGARLEVPPTPLPNHVDIERRDRLFDELQTLRESSAATERDKRIRDLEEQLNALLEDRQER